MSDHRQARLELRRCAVSVLREAPPSPENFNVREFAQTVLAYLDAEDEAEEKKK